MVKALAKIFIKDSDNVNDPQVRSAYGMLCSVVGILLNVALFAGKFFAGTISKSVSITADAFNNLSDAGSSVITLLGFKLASQKPDPDHPFGHGRIEYLSGLVVSMAILLMGWELATSSVDKIRNPQAVEFSLLSMGILVVSIVVKLYMGMYNNSIGNKINSAAMKATGADCISDCVSTTVVLIAAVVGHFTGLLIDGWCGLLISVFILRAGIEAAKDTIAPLLGQKPDEELVNDIYAIVMDHPEVLGVHDLVVHDYGPGRLMITLHAEVSSQRGILETHDMIDNIEDELKEKLNCEATIHMDPVDMNNETVVKLRMAVARRMNELLGEDTSIHDFRMVSGPTHTNIIYDIVVPFGYKYSDSQVAHMAKENISAMENGQYRAVVKIDHAYS
ncbi:MAG: cation transporter [Oscillospiraceae bacterium]|nr:cation transporter [Oscillospiraceae bacterium]